MTPEHHVVNPAQFKDHPHRKHYMAGWRSGQAPSEQKMTNADARRAHPAWYTGYFDAEGGRQQFEGWMPTGWDED